MGPYIPSHSPLASLSCEQLRDSVDPSVTIPRDLSFLDMAVRLSYKSH